jgi:hypothetical protein
MKPTPKSQKFFASFFQKRRVLFFFEKKNQKTFATFAPSLGVAAW